MPSLGDKIFAYTPLKLEQSVNDFFASQPSLCDIPPPILSEVALDKLTEVKKMEVVPLLSLQGTEAMVITPVFMHRDLTVLIDQLTLDHRDGAPYNMALAEELGHIQLHRAVMLDIKSEEDFKELQAHPKWDIAERDAKFWGLAFLMPSHLLEPAAKETYERLVSDMGFRDTFQLASIFISHLATMFQIPLIDAQKRIDTYIGDMRNRLDQSIAARSLRLIDMSEYARITMRRSKELTQEQLFGEQRSSRTKK